MLPSTSSQLAWTFTLGSSDQAVATHKYTLPRPAHALSLTTQKLQHGLNEKEVPGIVLARARPMYRVVLGIRVGLDLRQRQRYFEVQYSYIVRVKIEREGDDAGKQSVIHGDTPGCRFPCSGSCLSCLSDSSV